MGWVYSAAAAPANDEAHALAQKFSQAAEEGEREDQKRKADEAKAKAAEAKAKADEAKAKAAEKQKAEAEKRKAAEARRVAEEAEMLRTAKEEADARRAADQARTEAAIAREAEQNRIEAERQTARNDAARADAERVAEEARQKKLAEDLRAEEHRLQEATRLAREVEEKRAADEKRLADEKKAAEEQRQIAERQAQERRIAAEKAEADRKLEAARVAEEHRKSEEARVAAIKRTAEEAEQKRRAEEARVADLKRQAEDAEAKRRTEEARLAEQRRMAEQQSAQQRAALEAQREAEAQRIAEKFRIARETRERNKGTRNSLGGPLPDAASPFVADAPAPRATYPQRVTVLVNIEPRRHGFAGAKMTANPVLCVGSDCYVSTGSGSDARVMRRGQALGPGNTIGGNAGVCRNRTTCVYRGITLKAPLSSIQPVDMGFLRHDRKETRTIEPDHTCKVNGSQLSCSAPIETESYRAWIIPEAVAEQAGAQALARAVDDGLPTARSATYGSWDSSVQALPTR